MSSLDNEFDSYKIDPRSSVDILWKTTMLETTSGSFDMDVNGSSTPVDFNFLASEEGVGSSSFVTRFTLLIVDAGNWDTNVLGNGVSLSNGIQIQHQTSGTLSTIAVMFNNLDTVTEMELKAQWQETFFYGDRTARILQLNFPNAIPLHESDSDFFRLRVRDNLTPIYRMQGAVQYFTEV